MHIYGRNTFVLFNLDVFLCVYVDSNSLCVQEKILILKKNNLAFRHYWVQILAQSRKKVVFLCMCVWWSNCPEAQWTYVKKLKMPSTWPVTAGNGCFHEGNVKWSCFQCYTDCENSQHNKRKTVQDRLRERNSSSFFLKNAPVSAIIA